MIYVGEWDVAIIGTVDSVMRLVCKCDLCVFSRAFLPLSWPSVGVLYRATPGTKSVCRHCRLRPAVPNLTMPQPTGPGSAAANRKPYFVPLDDKRRDVNAGAKATAIAAVRSALNSTRLSGPPSKAAERAPEFEVLTKLVQAWKPDLLENALGMARKKGEMAALKVALRLAREEGHVAQELIEAGERRLAELKKLAALLATTELHEAMQGTAFMALDKALEQAKKVGVKQELIESGVQRLPHLATKELQEATQGTNVMALGKALTQAWRTGLGQELRATGEKRLLELPKGAVAFEETTPMLVMPFEQFKAQGRICKSTKAWREEAFEKKWLVEYDESSGKVVIFVSHT